MKFYDKQQLSIECSKMKQNKRTDYPLEENQGRPAHKLEESYKITFWFIIFLIVTVVAIFFHKMLNGN